MKDYYKILNVSEKATPLEIKNSYRQLAKRYHPDVVAPNDPQASQMFSEINEAHDVLSDPAKKAEYDKQRAGGSAANMGARTTARPQGGYGTQTAGGYANSPSGGAASSAQADEAIKKQATTVATYCATIAVKSFVGMDADTAMRLLASVKQNMFNNIFKLGMDGKTLGYNYGYRVGRDKGIQEGRASAPPPPVSNAGSEQQRREIARLESELARSNRLIASYEQEINGLNDAVRYMNAQVSDLRATVDSNELLIQDLNDTITENKGDLLTKDDIIEQTKQDKKAAVDDCLRRYTLLQSEYENYKRSVEEGTRNNLQSESELRSRLNNSEAKNLALNMKIDELRGQIEDYAKRLAASQKIVDNMFLNKS